MKNLIPWPAWWTLGAAELSIVFSRTQAPGGWADPAQSVVSEQRVSMVIWIKDSALRSATLKRLVDVAVATDVAARGLVSFLAWPMCLQHDNIPQDQLCSPVGRTDVLVSRVSLSLARQMKWAICRLSKSDQEAYERSQESAATAEEETFQAKKKSCHRKIENAILRMKASVLWNLARMPANTSNRIPVRKDHNMYHTPAWLIAGSDALPEVEIAVKNHFAGKPSGALAEKARIVNGNNNRRSNEATAVTGWPSRSFKKVAKTSVLTKENRYPQGPQTTQYF